MKHPSMPMPGVFSTMNSLMQGSVVGKNLKTISADLPDGEIIKQEGFVKSKLIDGTSVYIGGKYDLLVELPDGSHMIVDLKISKPGDGKAEMYKSQLWAYKYALENRESGEPIQVSRLALLIFYPESVVFENGVAKLSFPPQWIEVEYNHNEFLVFMKEIDALLTGPLPAENENCQWCRYRHIGEQLAHNTPANIGETSPF